MKYYTGILFIIIGIIAFLITLIVNDPSYFMFGSVLIIIIGIIWMYYYSNDSSKFNFREMDSNDNCTKCIYCDINPSHRVNAHCKFLNINVDEFHICDLYEEINQ